MDINFKEFNSFNIAQQQDIMKMGWILFQNELSIKTSEFNDSYVILDETNIIGMINFNIHDGKVAYIYHFEVLIKRQGYGTACISKLKNNLKNKVEEIITDSKDEISHNFWLSQGFIECSDDLVFYFK